MDYIQEELLRQKKVLAVLMSGGTTGTERKEERSERTDVASSREKSEKQSFYSISAEGDAEELRMELAEELAGRIERSIPRDPNPVFAGGRSVPDLRRDAASGRALSRIYSIDTGRNPGYVVSLERTITGGTTDVRTVSRSIQRDARRYDGGFSIY